MTRTILIVEDNDLCRRALELTLRTLLSFELRIVESAEQALDCLATGNFCALLADLHLPAMDGFQLIQTVRAQPRHAKMPILVISADGDQNTPVRVCELGANSFLQKPYSPSELRLMLESLI